jgi:four helix bundle suffix protein
LIYDGTVSFCDRFINPRSRTHDQMVQAARSGRQNIAEGSRAGATSSKSETYLTNVARASLDELLLDFEDFLRQRKLIQWAKNDSEALAVRRLGKISDPTGCSEDLDNKHWARYSPWLENNDPCVVANTLICLIHQANYLLDQQITALERSIIKEGGYREKLTAARLAERGKRGDRSFHPSSPTNPADTSDSTDQTLKGSAPVCLQCGKPMKQRIARKGKNAGTQFWGCTGYPDCKSTRSLK